ncbi:MAG: hypothetical protein ABSD31_10515 [Candidatus Binataceae bacterium]|jgi:hypothetical protein
MQDVFVTRMELADWSRHQGLALAAIAELFSGPHGWDVLKLILSWRPQLAARKQFQSEEATV